MSNITMNDADRTASVGVSATTAYLKLQDADAMSADNNSVTINKQFEVVNSMSANSTGVTINKQLELLTNGTLGTNLISTLTTLIHQTIYPVGSLYVTMDNNVTNPRNILGFGNWVQIVGEFLYCAQTADQYGGEATHTLTVEEMPSHTHEVQNKGLVGVEHDPSDTYTCKSNYENEWGSWSSSGLRSLATGGLNGVTQPHNNMPPYVTVRCWRRTG